MPRIARVVIPGLPHHVTQRGNGRHITFLTDDDRLVYLDLLRKYKRKYALRIWAYCLMDNHIHLLAVPDRNDSLARALGRCHADYAKYWNVRRTSCGHLWQARFFSCPIQDESVWTVARYVEMNPVRANLVGSAELWRWSSAEAHTAGRDACGILDMSDWARLYDSARWGQVLRTGVEEESWQQRLEEATVTGRPFGTSSFIEELERRLGHRLRPLPRGRRKKTGQNHPPEPVQIGLEIGD